MLLFLLACSSGGDSDTAVKAGPAWVAVGEGLDAALLSLWGTAWDDVWVVGADQGSGGILLHFDGSAWESVGGLGDGDAWWIEGTGDSLWISGSGGRVFSVDPVTRVVTSDVLDPSVILYGIWGPSANEAWAVGGVEDATENGAVMFHYLDGVWSPVELPEAVAAQTSLFKINGNAADDVWVVGAAGTAMHWDGSAWSTPDTGVTANLFAFDGRYAVGGNFTGTLLSWNGSGFAEESPLYAYQFAGVVDDGVHPPTAVGTQGEVYQRSDLGWELDESATATLEDLHAVWIDPEGGIWAVGGHLSSEPLIHGVLVYHGARTLAPLESL